MYHITAKQQLVLAFIVRYQSEQGKPPSRRDIVREFGWSSNEACRAHLAGLVAKGYISLDRGEARGIKVLCADAGMDPRTGLRMQQQPQSLGGAH